MPQGTGIWLNPLNDVFVKIIRHELLDEDGAKKLRVPVRVWDKYQSLDVKEAENIDKRRLVMVKEAGLVRMRRNVDELVVQFSAERSQIRRILWSIWKTAPRTPDYKKAHVYRIENLAYNDRAILMGFQELDKQLQANEPIMLHEVFYRGKTEIRDVDLQSTLDETEVISQAERISRELTEIAYSLPEAFRRNFDEASLSRVWQYFGSDLPLAIISPWKEKFSAEQNQRRECILRADVRELGFGIMYLFGFSIENEGKPDEEPVREEALLVIGGPGEDQKVRDFSVHLCRKLKMESVIYKPSASKYSVQFLGQNGKVLLELNNASWGKIGRNYSDLRQHKGRTFVFESACKPRGWMGSMLDAAMGRQ